MEEELIRKIHSLFALVRVQSDSLPSAMSTVHFAVRTARATMDHASLKSQRPLARDPVRTEMDVHFLIAYSYDGRVRKTSL